MCVHDLIVHMCTGSVEPQVIMIMMIHIIYLLFFSSRAWMAFYDKSSVQIFEPIKQQLTEHSAILYAFFVFTTRYVIQLPGVGFNCI